MKKTIAPFSALYRPRIQVPSVQTEPVVLNRSWTPESDPQYPHHNPTANFDSSTGEYTIPLDGLYTIRVQLIPINGGALTAHASRRRNHVDYAVRLTIPPDRNAAPDAIQSDYLDVGSVNFGQLIHLKAGTKIACLNMPGGNPPGRDCLRLMVEIVQRKRKPYTQELTRKQIKKRRKEKRKAEAISAASRARHSGNAQVANHQRGIAQTFIGTMNNLPSSPPTLSSNTPMSYPTSSSPFTFTDPTSFSPTNSMLTMSSTINNNNSNSNSINTMPSLSVLSPSAVPTGTASYVPHTNLPTPVIYQTAVQRNDKIPINDNDDDDDDDDDSSDDSDWETGFESDSTADELPHSIRNVNRLAKRLKVSAGPSSSSSSYHGHHYYHHHYYINK